MTSPSLPRDDASLWLKANLVCLVSMVVWSMGFPANERLLVQVDPATLAAIRMILAAVVLLFVWGILEGAHTLFGAPWAKGLAIGGFAFGLGSVTMLYAQMLTDATTVAVVSSMLPVVGVAMEALFDGRRMTLRLAVGMLLSLAGGILAIAAGLGAMQFGLGALMSFLSVAVFAWGSRATVHSLPELSPVGRTAITAAGAALATGAVAFLLLAFGQARIGPNTFGAVNLWLFAFSGFASFALSQLLWIVSTERLGVGVAGMHINATPFYVMAFMWALGGSWSWPQAGAAMVVGIGVLIAQWPSRRSE